VNRIVHWVVEPGFFSNQPVRVALVIGGAVAVVSAVAGVFTVVRGQSFAGHSLTDVSTAGGSGAFLVGADPVVGFVGFGVVGAVVMDLIGVHRTRSRDLATGVVLGASIGLAALFLYLSATSSNTTGATQHILFGSIFTTTSSTIPIVIGFGVVVLGIVGSTYRPLLLSTVDAGLAAARGVPVRLVGLLFMVAMAVAVGLSSLVIGSILSTALLIAPAAAALRLTSRVSSAIAVASLIGVGGTWLGILLAWDSASWGSSHQGLPVSFFIVSVLFAAWVLSGFLGRRRTVRTGPAGAPTGSDRELSHR
jgi:zinc/manganese transport system permease protein